MTRLKTTKTAAAEAVSEASFALVDLVLYQVLLLQSRTQSLAMKGSKDIMATK